MPELAEIVAGGDYRESLEALRDRLAEELDICHDGTKVAALAKQLRDVLNTLKSMPGKEKSVRDELADRRKDRRARASAGASPGVERGAGGDRPSS